MLSRVHLAMAATLALSACADADDQADRSRRFGTGVFEETPEPPPGAGGAGGMIPPPGPGPGGAMGPGMVVINEVAAKGEPEDWFEVFNIDDRPVDLTGWTFIDDVTAEPPAQGTFAPGAVLMPGQFLRVEVSDEATGFKLGGDEALILFTPNGQVADAVDWSEGDSPEGGSLARIPDGVGVFRVVSPPTPGTQNTGR